MKHTTFYFCLCVMHGLEHGLSRDCFLRNAIGTLDKAWDNSYSKQRSTSRIPPTICHVNLYLFIQYNIFLHRNQGAYHRFVVSSLFSLYLDFPLKPCKGLHLLILCCFVIYVHRGCNICVSHNLLNYLQVSFVFAETSAECMSQMVATEMR